MRDREVFELIRRRLDCRNVASHYGLRVGSGGYFQCPAEECPSHKGRRLTALTSKGESWKCQACDLQGDSVDLIEQLRGVDTKEAIEIAKSHAGIIDDDLAGAPRPERELPPRPPDPEIEIDPEDLKLRFRALTIATDHYDRLRREGADYLLNVLGPDLPGKIVDECGRNLEELAWPYLNARGLPPCAPMPIPYGLVPAKRTGLIERLRREHVDLIQAARRVGLLMKRNDPQERFRGRLFLPWRDGDGRTVNAKGRAIRALAEPCGLGMKDGRLRYPMMFLRSRNNDPKRPPQVPKVKLPFGWYACQQAGPEGPLVVVEGETDALSIQYVGRKAIATGGTSGVGRPRLKELINPTSTIVLFDNDKAGRKAAKSLAGELQCAWSVMPRAETDPNDYLRSEGPGRLRELIDQIVAGADQESSDEPPSEPPPPLGGIGGGDGDGGGRPLNGSTEGLPWGWGLRGDMLCRVKIARDGKEDWTPTGIRHPPAIAWRGRDVHDGTIMLGLRARVLGSRDDVEIPVARSKLKDGRSIVAALSDFGVDVDSTKSRHMIRFLSDCEHAQPTSAPWRLGSRQLGWHSGSFLYGRECYGDRAITYIGDDGHRVDRFGARGNANGWIASVLRPLERYPLALFGLYASLAAPVVAHVPGITGFVVEYADASGTGKSTVSRAAASAWGNPTRKGLLLGPFDTWPTLELIPSLHGNLPLFLEDSHLIDPKERLRNLIMAWADGVGRGKANRDGKSTAEHRTWATVGITTGEASVLRSTSYGGVGSRTICLERPLPGSQDEPIPQVIEDIQVMEHGRERHFGWAGRAWVQHLVAGGLERVVDAYDEWVPVLRRHAGNSGPEQRWAKHLALVVAVAQEAGPVIGSSVEADSECLGVSIRYLHDQAVPDQARDALELTLAWVAMDAGGGLERDDEASDRPRKIWFRREDDGTVCVGLHELAARLEAEGIYLRQVRKVWLERGWLQWQGEPKASVPRRLATGQTRCLPIAPHVAADFAPRPRRQFGAYGHGQYGHA